MAWTLALLAVGGMNEPALREELTRAGSDRFAFAERLRRVWIESAPARITNRLARLLPELPVALETAEKNPEARRARDSGRKVWGWQGARFEYEARDGSDIGFAILAARACRAAGGLAPTTYLDLELLPVAKLTPAHPRVDAGVNLRVIGARESETVIFRVLSPGGGWVRAKAPAQLTLEPLKQGKATVAIAAGERPLAFPEARGVLIEATAGGRTYHRRLPLSLDDITDQLQLFIRSSPAEAPTIAREIRLRPDGTPAAVQLILANPTTRDRKVIARLAGLGREVVLTVPGGKTMPLTFPAPPAFTPPIPPMGGLQTDLGVIVPGGELTLELLNPTDREEILQTIRVPVIVANPADYLRVTDPVFLPAAGAKPNRLGVTVVPGKIPPGGPCAVRLAFPDRRDADGRRLPGLVVQNGNLVGPVSRGGSPLTLYAENLALSAPGGLEVRMTVAADGVDRIATYTATLTFLGETVRLTPITRPMVGVNVDRFATGTAPLPVTLEVDNAPAGATLELLVGTAPNSSAAVAADLTMSVPTAKNVAARVKFDPKGESLLLTGSIQDHRPALPVELLVGKRVLEARLLDANRNVLATDRVDVVFDGSPPRNVRFLDLPPKARKEQPLAVHATCDPPISGIKEVKFFLGRPQSNAPPQNAPMIAGKLFDAATNEWRAAIPIEGQKGMVTVGVQFVTNAGLSRIETQDVELVDAAEINKPEPGKIAGKVIELRLPQKDRVVFLYDEKGNAKDKKRSKDDGTFVFPDVSPGRYFLFTQNEYANTQAKVELEVKPGETAKATLELLLK
ncbi:MAG TPA: hypothetical protein VLM40_06070 [Gemmata sp.]|nr:hypothetical protein [Gemmata sp.]